MKGVRNMEQKTILTEKELREMLCHAWDDGYFDVVEKKDGLPQNRRDDYINAEIRRIMT